LQHVSRPTARVARVAWVLLALGWDCDPQVGLPQRRDRHGAPRVGGHLPDGAGPSGLERPGALRP